MGDMEEIKKAGCNLQLTGLIERGAHLFSGNNENGLDFIIIIKDSRSE